MPHITEAAPLQISRFYTGLYTYRNPIIVPIRQFGRRIIELYDAISDGLNMENSNRLTLDRRPGYTAYNSNFVNGIPLFFYSFKPANFPNQIYVVADTTADLEWIQPGTLANTVLVTKETPAPSTFSQVAAFMYIANSNSFVATTGTNAGQSLGTEIKWDSPAGVQGITKWGIDIFAAAAGQGPNTYSSIGNTPLALPAPAWGTAGAGAVTLPPATVAAPSVSQFMTLTGFGFSFTSPPPPYITGVKVTVTGMETSGEGISLNVGLFEYTSGIGFTKPVMLPANGGSITLGGPSDLWNTNIQPNDVSQFTFGVQIQAVNASTTQSATFTITGVTMQVFAQGGPDLETQAGSITAQVGYQYQYTFGNSYSGHISSPTYPSVVTTGPNPPLIVPSAQNVLIFVTPSPDPQVNPIHFYRTTDGGGEPFYELPNSPIPNAVTTTLPDGSANPIPGTAVIVDDAQDWQLQISQICPAPHFNDPPPQGAVDPVWFSGRLWMHQKNLLYFASGPDITQGNGQEAWFPEYVFEIPHATIIRKFPLPGGMLVVTNDDIYVVRGTSTTSFTVNDFMPDTGLRSWYAADTDGSNVYLFTSDRQFLLINANGMSPLGSNIADILQALDPNLVYLAQYRYTQAQQFIFIGDGSTYVYPYNQELQCFTPRQGPVGGIRAIANVETQSGVFEFWRGKPSANSTVTFRDVTVWADEGTPYPCYSIFGPITVADYLTLAQLKNCAVGIAYTSTPLYVSILPNEVLPVKQHQFQPMEFEATEPPELSETLSFRVNRYTWKSTTYPEICNFVFLRLDFGAFANPDQLWNWTLGGTQTTGGSALGQPGQLPQIQGR